MKVFPTANEKELAFIRKVKARISTLMICAAIVYSGVYMGDRFYEGMRGYVKYLLKQEHKQKYNNPNQPDSYVNDPGRYWYS
jgi:hypothetical protein